MERLAALKQRRAEAEQVLAAQVSLQQTRERLAELAESERYDKKRSGLRPVTLRCVRRLFATRRSF